jgi:hypothetical protein
MSGEVIVRFFELLSPFDRTQGPSYSGKVSHVDLGDEEGGALPAKRPNSSLLEEAMCAMGALAGDPRANAHYMELHNEDVARRATSCVSAQEDSYAVCARFLFVKKIINA